MGCSESKLGDTGARAAGSNTQELNGELLEACRERSTLKRDAAQITAVNLFKQTQGKRFYDTYVRPTLVSYGASCKVLVAWHRLTQKKVRHVMQSQDPGSPNTLHYHNLLNFPAIVGRSML